MMQHKEPLPDGFHLVRNFRLRPEVSMRPRLDELFERAQVLANDLAGHGMSLTDAEIVLLDGQMLLADDEFGDETDVGGDKEGGK